MHEKSMEGPFGAIYFALKGIIEREREERVKLKIVWHVCVCVHLA